MKVYNYNKDFIYTNTTEALRDPIENKPMLPGYATFSAIPNYDTKNEFIVYEKEKDSWNIYQKCVTGTYFDKSNGNSVEIDSEFFIGDLSLYTQDAPNLKRNDKTTIHYVNGNWEYNQIDISFLREKVINDLRGECRLRIRSFNGYDIGQNRWLEKSQNYQDTISRYNCELMLSTASTDPIKFTYTQAEYENAKKILDRKEALRKQYHAIKETVLDMDINDLKVFDCTLEDLWYIG